MGRLLRRHIQLKQHPVRVAIGEPLLALLLEVSLEGAYSLGVVSLEAINDLDDLLGPLLGVFDGAHGGRVLGYGEEGGGEVGWEGLAVDEVGRYTVFFEMRGREGEVVGGFKVRRWSFEVSDPRTKMPHQNR